MSRRAPMPLLRAWPAALLLLPAADPASAQALPDPPHPSLVEALGQDVEEVREKLEALAGAIPPAEWDWRPGPGVRSVEEVLRHIAYDSYYLPTAAGVPAPAATGITRDYETARAYGERSLTRHELLQAVDASLIHLRAAMEEAGDSTLGEPVTVFGRETDRQGLWVLATVHLHEHLGQLIAYARVRGIVPPWSAGG